MSETVKKQSQTGRFLQIVTILRKHGAHKGMDPVKFREILEDLGPTYVKIGQIMATRQDMFSQRYCKELLKLRSEARPMPFETVKAIVDQACDGKTDQYFESIDEVPLGSASIAQVHAARLKDGTRVVIKVQRPGIYQEMEEDVRLIRKASRLLKLSDVFSSVVDADTVIDEFWTTAQQEMDFTHEADNAIRFKKNFAACQYIGAPSVWKDLTSRTVMVMEYVPGFTIEQKEQLQQAGYDPKEIAEKLAFNYLSQILDYGFFHADPHAGNLRISNGQIVYIDFGMMGELSERDRKLMKQAINALAAKDIDTLTETILTLGVVKAEPDYTALRQDVEKYVNTYCDTSLQDINLVQMVQEMFTICHQYKIMLPKGISMLARSLVTIEASMQTLDSSTDVMKIVTSHKSALLDQDWTRLFKDGLTKTARVAGSMLDIPVQTSDVLKMVQRGQVKVNLQLVGSSEPMANADRMVNRLVICLLIAALLMSSSIICTTDLKPKLLDIPLLGLLGYFIAFCMSLWLFVKMLFLHQKNKPF